MQQIYRRTPMSKCDLNKVAFPTFGLNTESYTVKWWNLYYNLGQLLQSEATFLQSEVSIIKWDKHYYKVRQLHTITKWVKSYLKWGKWFITTLVNRYYKMGQVLHNGLTLLPNETSITKLDDYYKVGQYIIQFYLYFHTSYVEDCQRYYLYDVYIVCSDHLFLCSTWHGFCLNLEGTLVLPLTGFFLYLLPVASP